jgi:hypothetical protein
MTDKEIELRLTELSSGLWSEIYAKQKCIGHAYQKASKRLEAAGAKKAAKQVAEDSLRFSLRNRLFNITREDAMKILALGLP